MRKSVIFMALFALLMATGARASLYPSSQEGTIRQNSPVYPMRLLVLIYDANPQTRKVVIRSAQITVKNKEQLDKVSEGGMVGEIFKKYGIEPIEFKKRAREYFSAVFMRVYSIESFSVKAYGIFLLIRAGHDVLDVTRKACRFIGAVIKRNAGYDGFMVFRISFKPARR